MNFPDWVTYAMAFWACILLAWVCYPHLLLILGITQYRNGVFGGREDLNPDDKSDRYQDSYSQLLELGFEPLGLHWSTIGRTISTQAYVFGLAEVPCMAEIFARSDNLYVITGFEGGVALETTAVQTNDVRADDFWLTSLPDASVGDLLAEHRRQVQEWVSQGRRSLPASHLDQIPTITRAAATSSPQDAMLRGTAWRFLGNIVVSAGIAALLMGLWRGFTGPWPWLGPAAVAASAYSLSQKSSTRVRLDKNTIQSTQPQSADGSPE